MKRIIVLSLIIFLFFHPQITFGHVGGVSIFKINGENTKIAPPDYSVPNIELTLPPDSDLAPKSYSLNEQLSFELDLTKFITPQSIFEKTDFIWDFGDGSSMQTIRSGSTNSYAYTKDGTYLLTIYADYSTAGFEGSIPEPQLIQAVVLTVGSGKSEISQRSNLSTMNAIEIGIAGGALIAIGIFIVFRKGKRKRK